MTMNEIIITINQKRKAFKVCGCILKAFEYCQTKYKTCKRPYERDTYPEGHLQGKDHD